MKARFAIYLGTLLVVGACGGSGDDTVLVSAASSLTDAFADMESAFEEANPGVDVVLNLGASTGLREQILQGAPADVFASANVANMDAVVAAGETDGAPRVFAHNRLQIAVPAGNPAGVAGLEDFATADLEIGLCAEAVPCGDLARRVLAAAGVVPEVDTNEPNVRALLTKIEAGELDAGIVYVTDVASSDGVVGIDLPGAVAADYPIAILAGATKAAWAAAFVEFVLSSDGRSILVGYGFSAP